MKELLIEALEDYFETNKDTYAYWLTRDKSAFELGTMTIDDFKEFNSDTIDDIAESIMDYIITHCAYTSGQEDALKIIALLTSGYR